MFCTQCKLITSIFQNNICIRGRSPRGRADLPTTSPNCLYLYRERRTTRVDLLVKYLTVPASRMNLLLCFILYQSILKIFSVGLLLGQNKTSDDVFFSFFLTVFIKIILSCCFCLLEIGETNTFRPYVVMLATL